MNTIRDGEGVVQSERTKIERNTKRRRLGAALNTLPREAVLWVEVGLVR